jgi:hypothetical protein
MLFERSWDVDTPAEFGVCDALVPLPGDGRDLKVACVAHPARACSLEVTPTNVRNETGST